MIPFQELERRNMLVKRDDLSLEEKDNVHVIFVSHEWLGWSHPDPQGIQIKTLVKVLKQLKSRNISRVDMNRFHSVVYVFVVIVAAATRQTFSRTGTSIHSR